MSDLRPNPAPADAPAGKDPKASHLAFVAHEIRNPLSTALWCAELLSRMGPEERGGARGEKLSRMTLRALTRLRRLIEDHLLAERLDAGGIPLELEEVPVRELVPAAAAVGAASVELELEAGLSVVGDPALLRRIVEGVLLAAARGGGDVRVSGARKGQQASIRVDGAKASSRDMTDPRRGDAGDTRGASLALPVARRAARLLGGAVRTEDGALLVELPASASPRRPS
ncbi:MAG TPA: histidine kinase dimerization/phospho-acceptor domain-containing protein [Anaeromyxobacteraceae bacterium]|nr:histidine kinase dimerization/phospho-acceptor domain-containing protein [Anaeromyxobacteraceae bacterium]